MAGREELGRGGRREKTNDTRVGRGPYGTGESKEGKGGDTGVWQGSVKGMAEGLRGGEENGGEYGTEVKR